MTDARQARLQELTRRWRARHEARLEKGPRAAADAEREARASTYFPWQSEAPAEYAARYGAAMVGYTYDAYTYTDAKLEAWLRELGQILRQRGRRC
jgi:hypothetical protein